MKSKIALRLLAEQLEWSDEQATEEFSALQLMITHKYDGYQGFQPASRFHVALLNWLSQFQQPVQRRLAFGMIKKQLVYITQREMHHLVSLMMPELDRLMRKQIAKELKVQLYETWTDSAAERRLRLLRRRTLFVGLSDGARIDVFRRYNEGVISNEQVVPFSEMSDLKWKSLTKELTEWLKENEYKDEPLFEAVCLVDDFAGSGDSLLRFDNEEGKWKGKISKFYAANEEKVGTILTANCRLFIHHHLASSQAENTIKDRLVLFSESQEKFSYSATYSYVLPESIVVNDDTPPPELINLIKTHYNKGIEDKHVGKDIWFGYKNCGLPLVLEHNTPNNSIALLWADSSDSNSEGQHKMKPLFARRKRHSTNG